MNNYTFTHVGFSQSFNDMDGRAKTPLSILDRTKAQLGVLQASNGMTIADNLLKTPIPYIPVQQQTEISNFAKGLIDGGLEIQTLVNSAMDLNGHANDPTQITKGAEQFPAMFLDSLNESRRKVGAGKLSGTLPYKNMDPTTLLIKCLGILQHIFVPDQSAKPDVIYQHIQRVFEAVGLPPQQNPAMMDHINDITTLFANPEYDAIDTITSLARMVYANDVLIALISNNRGLSYEDSNLSEALTAMSYELGEIIKTPPHATPAAYAMADIVEEKVLKRLIDSGRLRADLYNKFKLNNNRQVLTMAGNDPYSDLSGRAPSVLNPNVQTMVFDPTRPFGSGVTGLNANGQAVPMFGQYEAQKNLQERISAAFNMEVSKAQNAFNLGIGPAVDDNLINEIRQRVTAQYTYSGNAPLGQPMVQQPAMRSNTAGYQLPSTQNGMFRNNFTSPQVQPNNVPRYDAFGRPLMSTPMQPPMAAQPYQLPQTPLQTYGQPLYGQTQMQQPMFSQELYNPQLATGQQTFAQQYGLTTPSVGMMYNGPQTYNTQLSNGVYQVTQQPIQPTGGSVNMYNTPQYAERFNQARLYNPAANGNTLYQPGYAANTGVVDPWAPLPPKAPTQPLGMSGFGF